MSNQSDPIQGDLPNIPDDLTATIAKPRLRGNMYERAEQRYYAELAAMQATIATLSADDLAPAPAEPAVDEVVTPAVTVAPVDAEQPPEVGPAIEEPAAFEVTPPPAVTVAAPPRADAPFVMVAPPTATKPLDAGTIARAVTSRQALWPLIVMATLLLVGAVAATLGIRAALQPPDDDFTTVASQPAPTPPPATQPAPQSAAVAPPAATEAPSPAPASPASVAPASAAPAVTPAITARAVTAPPVREASRTTTETVKRPVASEGQIRITSTPPGARVTVNGIGWGQTPLTIRALPFGTKNVRLTREGYRSVERSVSLSGGDPTATLSITMPKR